MSAAREVAEHQCGAGVYAVVVAVASAAAVCPERNGASDTTGSKRPRTPTTNARSSLAPHRPERSTPRGSAPGQKHLFLRHSWPSWERDLALELAIRGHPWAKPCFTGAAWRRVWSSFVTGRPPHGAAGSQEDGMFQAGDQAERSSARLQRQSGGI